MNGGGPPPALPPAGPDEPVHYVVIDDEPRYRQGLNPVAGFPLTWAGGWASVDEFRLLQRRPCHVVVLDLCLNRLTGDPAVLQGVNAIKQLVRDGQRVLVYTAEERPDPIARCVAAGAAGYASKYLGDDTALAQAVLEIGRTGSIVTDTLHDALRKVLRQCHDLRLSATLERTLQLLDRGLTDKEVAARLFLSRRTVEEHKQKILALYGEDLENRRRGFADLRREHGVGTGDLVNDVPADRPAPNALKQALSWLTGRHGRRR